VYFNKRGDFMDNYLVKAYGFNNNARIYTANTTGIIKHVQGIWNMWPTSCAALGRTMTMALIMSCTYKNDEALNIFVKGDGPIGKIVVEAHDGKARGYCENPGVYLSHNNGHLNVSMGVGKGEIEVVKDLHMREPFSSSSPIVSGEIAEDFAYYFASSEQIPSAVGLGVQFDKDSKVISAGGFLIQLLPGYTDETINSIEKAIKELRPCSDMIKDGMSCEDMLNEITKGDYKILEKRDLAFECPCSKERFEKGFVTLGKDELKDIITKEHGSDVTCNFCNKKYHYSEDDLNKILNKMDK
jgi:molecular chaperone Hsp33